mmetsp:Transcript_22423/g.40442  ORF Transcript_22423/g.40442 Transcript_22423/m.40442 type:complete len:864 (-) Transcript_22423:16-2607(-)
MATEGGAAEGSEDAKLLPGTHGGGICQALHLGGDSYSRLITTGADGRLAASNVAADPPVRAWAQKLSKGLGGPVTIAVSNDGVWLAVAEETDVGFQVWVHQLDEKGRMNGNGVQKPRSAGRFTLDVRHLCWHPTLPYLCMATDDGKVDIWWDAARLPDGGGPSTSRGNSKRQLCKTGNSDGAARCACFDPRGDRVAAAFASGQLVIFGIQDGSEKYRASIWQKAVPGKEQLSLAWHPDGEQLVLPGEPYLRVLASSDFSKEALRLEGGHRFSTTLAAWSASGDILATASFEAVALWSSGKLAKIFGFAAQPCSLVWGGSSFLAVGTEAGSMARLQASSSNGPASEEPKAEIQSKSQESEDQDATTATPRNEVQKAARSEETAEMKAAKVQVEAVAEIPVAQARFQPGATGSESSRRRYLAWNENGSLKLSMAAPPPGKRPRGVQAAGSVEVEYSRERGRSAVREVKAFEGLSFGALGPGNCVLVSKPGLDQSARIVVHLANPWEQRASFDSELPPEETPEAVAVGRHFVAVATAPHRFLRISTTSLMPIAVLALASDVVSMAACEDLLLVISEAPGPKALRAEPCLEFCLYGVSNKERLASGWLPLSPGASLRWIGFSAEAQPLALDTAGVLRTMAFTGGNDACLSMAPGTWLPVAELEGNGALLWPVRAEAGAILCAPLGKPREEPRVGAVQRLTEIRYKLPLGLDGELYERLLRHSLLSAQVSFAMSNDLLPAPARRAAREASGAPRRGPGAVAPAPSDDGKQVAHLFQKLVKSNDLEQALDVAIHYFASAKDGMQKEVRLLQSAQSYASTAGKEELGTRLEALLATRTLAGEAGNAEEVPAKRRAEASLESPSTSRVRTS